MNYLFSSLFLAMQLSAGTPELARDVALEWSKFQAALKADDLETLIAMAKFPLRSNEFGGDIKSPSVFKARYKTIFPGPTKQCMAGARLHREKVQNRVHFEVACDVGPYPIRFIFNQVGTKLYLTVIDNVNE